VHRPRAENRASTVRTGSGDSHDPARPQRPTTEFLRRRYGGWIGGRHETADHAGELEALDPATEGAFNVVVGLGEVAGAALAAHPDVDKIAFTGAGLAAFRLQGQDCVCGSRLFVHERVADAFAEGLAKFANGLSVGPGLDKTHMIGPAVALQTCGDDDLETIARRANDTVHGLSGSGWGREFGAEALDLYLKTKAVTITW